MEKYNKAFKFRILPTKEQEILIKKTFGSTRLVYNIFLDKRIKLYESEKNTRKSYMTNNVNNVIRIEEGKLKFPKLKFLKVKFHRLIPTTHKIKSSKTCSSCGLVKSILKLNERIYNCNCGLFIDRVLNN